MRSARTVTLSLATRPVNKRLIKIKRHRVEVAAEVAPRPQRHSEQPQQKRQNNDKEKLRSKSLSRDHSHPSSLQQAEINTL